MRSGLYRAKLFQNGGSQAVRLPRACRFEGEEVIIRREGDRLVLEPISREWSPEFLAAFVGEKDEVFGERQQPTDQQERGDVEP